MESNNEILEKLKNISLFHDFENDSVRLNKIISFFKHEKFKSGDSIIVEGEIGNNLYILHEGTIRIIKKTLNEDRYTVSLVNSKDNVFFGEIALVDKDKRSATVVAESDCLVYSIDKNSFMRLCELDPVLGFKITLQIAKKISLSLRKMNEDVVVLFQALVNEVKGN